MPRRRPAPRSELRRPPIAFTLTDAGSGHRSHLTLRCCWTASTWRRLGSFDGGGFSLRAGGRSGVRLPRAARGWRPTAPATRWRRRPGRSRVADRTPPGAGRPAAGDRLVVVATARRTISVAAFDGGTGVDPATLGRLPLDGRDVSRLGDLLRRPLHLPAASDLLALGDHVVVPGSPTGPATRRRRWSGTSACATRRRRPSTGRLPAAGLDRARRGGHRLRRGRRRLRRRPGTACVVTVDGSDVTGVGDVRRLPFPLRARQPRRGRPHGGGDRRRPLGQRRRPGDVAVRRRQPGDRPPGRGVRPDAAGVRPVGDDRARTRRPAASRWPARGCWSRRRPAGSAAFGPARVLISGADGRRPLARSSPGRVRHLPGGAGGPAERRGRAHRRRPTAG